jgi:hypothetical protein
MFMMAACRDPFAPADVLCHDYNAIERTTVNLAPQATVDCVVNAMNEALECEQFSVNGLTVTNKITNAMITIHFVSHDITATNNELPSAEQSEVKKTGDYCGYTFNTKAGANPTYDIYVDNGNDASNDAPSILAHELGHSMLLTFPDNPTDSVHSLDVNNLMYYSGTPFLSKSNLATMANELQQQNLTCK